MSVRGKNRRVWRKRMLREQDFRCYWCRHPVTAMTHDGQPFRDEAPAGQRWATFDHVIPSAFGGATARSNLVIACHVCNAERGQRITDARGAMVE